ncbi:MAG: hypothetical protein EPO32_03845 [Anaerolineae bacterium]|nr:MAG: hypothetical protein EPO32_03845 [Anaerolineae bacterium]
MAFVDTIKMIRRLSRSPLILLLLAPLVLYAPIFLTGKAVFWGTQWLQFAPWWAQAARTLAGGELPLWNPLSGLGAPLLANHQSALLYPPTWLYLLAHALGGIALMAWLMAPLAALHLAWGGWGMARLARALGWGTLAQTVSGLAFGLSGYLVARSHFLSINAAAAWTPWVLLAAFQIARRPGRRSILVFALVTGLQLLAGHAQTTWYTLVLALAFVLFWGWQAGGRRPALEAAGRFALGGVWAAAMAAAQLLPTAEYLLHSQRAGAYAYDLAMQHSYWPWRLLALVAPSAFGNPAHGDHWGVGVFWEDAAYFGVLGLLLAGYALLRRKAPDRALRMFLLACILVSFALALGQNTSLFPFLYKYIPTFDMFQAPARWLLLAQVAFALLAGLGADQWRAPEGRALYWSRLGTAGALAVTLGAGLGWFVLSRRPLDYPERLATFVPAIALAGLWALGAGALHLTAPLRENATPRRGWAWAVVLWLAADLLVAGWGLNPGASLAQITEPPPALPLAHGARVFLLPHDEEALKFETFLSARTFDVPGGPAALRAALIPNTNLLDGISAAGNFDPLLPYAYAEIMGWFALPEGMAEEDAYAAWQASLEYLNIGLLVRPDGEGGFVYQSGLIRPFKPARLHYFPAADSVLCCGERPLRFEWLRDSANQVQLLFSAPAAGQLVLADLNYPGWQAELDGERIPLSPDNRLRSVDVPAGEHTLRFIYRPFSFYVGAAVGVLALLGWAALWRKTHAAE